MLENGEMKTQLHATPYTLPAILFLFLFIGCAPTFKAAIDTGYSGQILWPGPPEKPRIKYLWSISNLGAQPRTIGDLIFGEEGVFDPVEARSFRTPQDVFLYGKRLYVADPGALRITVVDLESLDAFHIYRIGSDERLKWPVSVVSDPTGRIYISDSENKNVYIFNEKGRYMDKLKTEFLRPTDMALWGDYLFVVDTLAHCIYRINLKDGSVFKFGKNGTEDGEFNYPTYITIRDGRLYVTDSMNNRIQIFHIDGSFIAKFGTFGDSYSDLEKPKGIAVDSEGHIYVVDSIQDRVKIFDAEGRLLLFFGEKGRGPGDFWLPSGIFIDKGDKIYVADTFNSRIQVFEHIKGIQDAK